MLEIIGVALFSFSLSVFAVTPLMIRISKKLDILDKPDSIHKTHSQSIPYLGGMGIVVTSASTLLILTVLLEDSDLRGILIIASPSIVLISVLGLIDDLYKLSARVRLILQFAISISLLTQLRGTAYYPEFFGIELIDSTLALVWLVFWANLLNMFDNHDGAASGVISIVFLGLSILAWLDGSTAIMMISITILSSTLGFLHWNWPPARIYLGDSGALLLSYTAGIFFLLIDFSNMSPLSALFVPMICGGVLLLDFLLVFFSRLKRGVSPTIGDKTHSAHRLLKKGLSKSRINLILYSFTIIGNLIGILVTLPQFSFAGELLLALIYLIMGALYLSRIGKLSY